MLNLFLVRSLIIFKQHKKNLHVLNGKFQIIKWLLVIKKAFFCLFHTSVYYIEIQITSNHPKKHSVRASFPHLASNKKIKQKSNKK